MEITNIFIVASTIVFTLLAFLFPIPQPNYWIGRGCCIILAIIGWLLVYRIWF